MWTRMAGILAGIAVCFHLSIIVNSITIVPWMVTRQNGVRRLTILRRMADGDYVTTR